MGKSNFNGIFGHSIKKTENKQKENEYRYHDVKYVH